MHLVIVDDRRRMYASPGRKKENFYFLEKIIQNKLILLELKKNRMSLSYF